MLRSIIVVVGLAAFVSLSHATGLRQARQGNACALECGPKGLLDSSKCSCTCAPFFGGDHCVTCTRKCQNGGELDTATCTCFCVGGYSGENCERKGTPERLGAPNMEFEEAARSAKTPQLKKLASRLASLYSGAVAPGSTDLAETRSSSEDPVITALTESSSSSADLMSEAMEVAESSELCRNWRYEVCRGQDASDEDGHFSLAEEVMCTPFNKASDTLKVLALRPGIDEDQYTKKSHIIHDDANVQGAPEHEVHEDLTKLGHEFGYKICFISEKEKESIPDTASPAVPTFHVKCTHFVPRPHLAAWMISKIFRLAKGEQADAGASVQEHKAADICQAPDTYSKKCCHNAFLPTCGGPAWHATTDDEENKKEFSANCDVSWPENTVGNTTVVDYAHRCPEGWEFKANFPVPEHHTPATMEFAEVGWGWGRRRRINYGGDDDDGFDLGGTDTYLQELSDF